MSAAAALDTACYFAAVEARKLGFSPIPLYDGKFPAMKWKPFMEWPMSLRKLQKVWTPNAGLGLVMCAGSTDAARNTISLDYDDVMDAYEEHRSILPANAVMRSGRESGGGRRVFLRVPEPIHTASHPQLGNGLKLLGRGSQTVLPPSLHPSGALYQWESGSLATIPSIELDHLEQIGFQPQPVLREIEARRPGWIPSNAWLILVGEQVRAQRHAIEQKAITIMLAEGLPKSSIVDAFQKHAYPGSKFQERRNKSEEEGLRWLEHSINKAQAYLATGRNHAEFEIIRRLSATIHNIDFPGRCGDTDRAVFGVLLRIIEERGKLVHNRDGAPRFTCSISLRKIAELSQIRFETVQKAIRRMVNTGWLQLVKPTDGLHSNEYVFVPDLFSESATKTDHSSKKEDVRSDPLMSQNFTILEENPVFRSRGGFGKNGLRIYLRLEETPDLTAAEISKAVRIVRRTVERKLSHMVRHEVVICEDRRYRLNPGRDLDAVASKLGLRLVALNQKLQHKAQRVMQIQRIERLKQDAAKEIRL